MSRYLLIIFLTAPTGLLLGRSSAAAETSAETKIDNEEAEIEAAAPENSESAATPEAKATEAEATETARETDTEEEGTDANGTGDEAADSEPSAVEKEHTEPTPAAHTPKVTIQAIPPQPETAEKPPFPKHAFLLSWDMAVPVGDTWRYIDAFSPAGVTFNYRYHFTPQLAVGALFGWNSFDVKEKGTFHYDNITVTGTQIRSMDALHFGAGLYYNILPITKKAVPFVGIDLETYHLQRAVDFGWWSAASSDWHFGFAPSIGALFHMPGITVLLSSKFQMAVQTPHSDAETYVSFNIGLGLD